VEYERPVSNEAEFEYWLVSAFESERKRLREREARDSQAAPASDRAATGEKKKEEGDVAAA
jgi:hypothetical protein